MKLVLLWVALSIPASAAPVCEPLSFPQELNTLQETSSLFKSYIIGKYASQEFRETCYLQFISEKKNEAYTCSATLVGEQSILTAAHCDVKNGTGKVSCSCGVDPKTNTEIFATATMSADPSVHPTYGKPEAGPIGFDVQLAHLDRAPLCPSLFKKIEKPLLPQSLAEAKSLIASGMCYFSGYGFDNDAKLGSKHSVQVPKHYFYASNNNPSDSLKKSGPLAPTEWITYASDSTIEYRAKETESEIQQVENRYHLSPEKRATIESQSKKNISNYVKSEEQLISDDPNKSNAFTYGDSGGSLICIKDHQHYLVGVLAEKYQSVILINDPAIWSWWENANIHQN